MKRLAVVGVLAGCTSGVARSPAPAPPVEATSTAVDEASARASTAPRDGSPVELDVPLVSGDAEPLASLRGKVVVLMLSSTDRPGWLEFRRHYERRLREVGKERLAVIAVANDSDAQALQSEWDRDPPPFLLGWDPDGALALRLGAAKLPAVFVLDPKGHVVGSLGSLDEAARAQLDVWVDERLAASVGSSEPSDVSGDGGPLGP